MANLIEFLKSNGGASVQYRLRRDILNEDSQTSEMRALHDQILVKSAVKKIIRLQHDDGWFGKEIHGVEGVDTSVWRLLNHGVDRNHGTFQSLSQTLLNPKPNEPYKRTFPGGAALDEDGRGGNNSVAAQTLASLGHEDNPIVHNEINLSLEHCRRALEHGSIDDFSKTNRSGSVRFYKPNAYFPGANHYCLLSATENWRTVENVRTVKESLKHCKAIMRGSGNPAIMYRRKSHYVGPFNFPWDLFGFSVRVVRYDKYEFSWWLRMLYQLSGFGFAKALPELAQEYRYLREIVSSGATFNKQSEQVLKGFKYIWSIEKSWKNDVSIKADLYFLGLLILKKAGYSVKRIQAEEASD